VNGAAEGYVTADACSALRRGAQATITATHGVTSASSNLALVRVDPDGSFCVYTQRSVHLVVDVVGEFGPSGVNSLFGTGARLLDTR
jgi:hypothetical protein